MLGENITLDKVREVLLQHEQTLKVREGEVGTALHAQSLKNSQKAASNNTNKHCTHCNVNTHTNKTCFKLHPELKKPAWWEKKNPSGASSSQTKGKREKEKEVFVASDSFEGDPGRWLIDSGASAHMSHLRDSFISLRPHAVTILVGKKGERVVSEGVGVVQLWLDVGGRVQNTEFQDVLYIPDLPVNLLSVAALANKNLRVEFNKRDGCVVYNCDEQLVAVGTNTGNNTYSLQLRKETAVPAVLPSPTGDQVSIKPATDLIKWHNRLGHISSDRIKQMATGLVSGMGKISFTHPIVDCRACALGKLKRKPISTQPASRVQLLLELVHSDVCGPMEVAGTGGAVYFALVIDDLSRYVFVLFLPKKSDLLEKLSNLLAFLKVNKNTSIKSLRCDNGGEYTTKHAKNFCHKNGISIEYTAPNSPQQNGVAERKNGSIMTLARCMLQRAKLPRKFWVEAVAHAVWLNNRSPTKAVLSKTPYEAWYGYKPDLSELKTFGCEAVVLHEQGHHTKLEPKGRVCKFLGLRIEGEGYKFLDPKTGAILASRNVQFQEQNTLEIGHSDPPTYDFINTNNFSFFRDADLPVKKEIKEEGVVVEPPLGLAPLLPQHHPVVQGPPHVSPVSAAVSTAGTNNTNPTTHTQPHTPPHTPPQTPQHTPVHSPALSVSLSVPSANTSSPSGVQNTQVSGNSGGSVSGGSVVGTPGP